MSYIPIVSEFEAVWALHDYVWSEAAAPAVETAFGWLGIEDTTVVAVQKISNNVFENSEDDVVHDANVKAVMEMVLNGGSFFPLYIKHTNAAKAGMTGYYYTGKNGRYINGLPVSSTLNGSYDPDIVNTALNTDIGGTGYIISVHTALPDYEVYFKDLLQSAPYYYIPWANTLTHLDALSVSYDDWEFESALFNTDTGNIDVLVFRWNTGVKEYATIPQADYLKEQSLVVVYTLDPELPDEWFYWIYKFSDGTYPEVSKNAVVINNSDVLPIGIVRSNSVDINVESNPSEHASVDNLLRQVGMTSEEIQTNMRTSENFSAVTDVYVNFSLCPNIKNEVMSKALWMHFYPMLLAMGSSTAQNEYITTAEEGTVNIAIVWTIQVYTPVVEGTIGNESEYFHEVLDYSVYTSKNLVQGGGNTLVIQKQVSPGIYSKIEIQDLNSLSAIAKDGYHNVAASNLTSEHFTIPLRYSVINELSSIDLLELYQYTLRIDIYALETFDVAYYESTYFAILFENVLLAISFISLGTASGPIEVIRQLTVAYLLSELVIYIAELTGNAELAAVVGLIAAIALSGTSAAPFDFTTAEGLLMASTNFANNLTLGYGVEATALAADIEELNASYEESMALIEDAQISDNPIDAGFLVALQSVDTKMYPAIKAQYNFDILYNYDKLVADFYKDNLRIGIV